MKRAGFTMIELIFVIVILGILAAVALPKFIGVAEQAHEGKMKAFVGTLNRTVGPALWSQSLTDGTNGSIKGATYPAELQAQLPVPEEFTGPYNVSACSDLNTSNSFLSGAANYATYRVACQDGNTTSSPNFTLYNGTTVID
jgi:prepilin-type N-terminal cleavage/methylation domain-containing protein